jgi:hypothetical protein
MECLKSEYCGVTGKKDRDKIVWRARLQYKGTIKSKSGFKTDREAAIFYDKMCINAGIEPVNILKRKFLKM